MKNPEGKKLCARCGAVKDYEQFAHDRTRKDGFAYNCGKCQAEKNKLWRNKNARNQALYVAARKNNAKKYPEKVKARQLVKEAIKAGILKKSPCRDCGEGKVHAHHPDHRKALEVIWLCPYHHTREHMARQTISTTL